MKRIYIFNGLDVQSKLKSEGFSDRFIDKHWLKFHYYLTKVLNLYRRREKSGDGFVKLYVDSIKKVIKPIKASTVPLQFRSKSKTVHLHLLIKKLLEKWKVILHYTEQHETSKSFHLKIYDEWYYRGYFLYKGDIPSKLAENIDKIQKENVSHLYGVYMPLYESFMKLKINEQAAIDWLDIAFKNRIRLKDKQDVFGRWISREMDIGSYSHYRFCIENFNDSKYFYLAKSGRVYSSLTNLPSLLRRFLSFEGEGNIELKEFDIPNAQPLLLNYVADTDELYQELTVKGEFYSYLKSELVKRGVQTGDNFKVDCFSKLFFGTHKRKSKIENTFEECFPISHLSIRWEKHRKGYKSLSHLLQKEEARIMYEGVVTALFSLGVKDVLVIHDAILCKPIDFSIVVEVMKNHFYKKELL